MDKLTNYRRLIQQLINEHVDLINKGRPTGDEDVRSYSVFDQDHDHYLLLTLGWDGSHRVRGMTLYVRLHKGKIRIEDDMTEEGIATQLLEAGVPKEDIVLAFQPPELRKHTEFAVA